MQPKDVRCMATVKKAGTYLRGSVGLLSSLFEGQTIRALIHAWVSLVGAYRDGIKRAKVFCFFMMFALIYSTSDRLMIFTSHNLYPPYLFASQKYYDQIFTNYYGSRSCAFIEKMV